MSRRTQLDQVQFDGLLKWLSPDQDEAGKTYEYIRAGLMRYFRFKGCRNDEELADETINRVAKKLPEMDLTTGNKPITYFYGFAANIFLEELRSNKREVELEAIPPVKQPIDASENEGLKFDCLDYCLGKLEPIDKELLIDYYRKDRSEKFEYRKKLAENLNLSIGTLHVKVHRLRQVLRICVEKCIGKHSL